MKPSSSKIFSGLPIVAGHSLLANLLTLVLAITLAGCATGLQRVSTPEEAGLSAPPLNALSTELRAKVDKGEIPGAVVLVARDGKIGWFEAIGYQVRETKTPMAVDSIFRIASMTKPITAVAVMMLVEEGKLKLDDPASKYLPEFKDVMVGAETKDAAGNPELQLVKPQREMTVQDLLRHTSGLTYGWLGRSMVKDRYTAAKLYDPGQSNADFVAKLAKLPLQSQPGTTWGYSHSYDVLARVVEVASGVDFDMFVAERITKPLGMVDTAFWVDPSKASRLAEPQADPATGKRPLMMPVLKRNNWTSGGGGLLSTAGDYARFCQFLLNDGTLDGVRLLSRDSVDAMRVNQLSAGTVVPPPAAWGAYGDLLPHPDNGQGWGYGFLVRVSPGTRNLPGSVGEYSWNGTYGTEFLIYPKDQLFAIQLVQLPPNGPLQPQLRKSWREDVYKSIAR
jgi:CubicO group peptidase (beta-lactamase class C family)